MSTPKRYINTIDYNWYAGDEHGDDYQTHQVGSAGVVRILDVSDHNAVTYRVEFEDGRAELIFNPNRVFEELEQPS